jgi:hypothetical protein
MVILRLCMIGMIAIAAAGCAATGGGTIEGAAGGAPTDFTLDVSVLTGADVSPRAEAHLRQSRIVVFADGSLHYGTGEALDANDLPGVTRLLDRRQMADVWRMVQEAGLGEPASGAGAVNMEMLEAGSNEIVYAATIAAHDERWIVVERFKAGQDVEGGGAGGVVPPAELMRLIRQMARLAWATDEEEAEVVVSPRRYDFGPDPYSQYREVGAVAE